MGPVGIGNHAKKKSGKPTPPEEMSKRVMVPILAKLAEEEGNTTALARWLDMSRTGALQLDVTVEEAADALDTIARVADSAFRVRSADPV